MLMLILSVVYIAVALLGIFVLTPFMKARKILGVPEYNANYELSVIIFSFWPLMIPVFLLIVCANYGLVIPGTKIYDPMVKYFTPKTIRKTPLDLDESKSTYRAFKFLK